MKLNQLLLDQLFTEIGKRLDHESKITICGGASIVLAHKFRNSTSDIDALEVDADVLDIARQVMKTTDFVINTDVKVTPSYSRELLQVRTFYKSFGNLYVYYIAGIALLCMKLKSMRADSFDYSDIKELIAICKRDGYNISDVYNMLKKVYPADASISVEAEELLHDEFGEHIYILDKEAIDSYVYMIQTGLMKMEELPSAFISQISCELQKGDAYLQLIQSILDKHQSSCSAEQIRRALPEQEIEPDRLEKYILYMLEQNI